MTKWIQRVVRLPAKARGFHLIDEALLAHLPELHRCQVGLLHLFIQHTSASLTLNENADPTVRQDFESHFSRTVPEGAPYYRHTYEGPDDMPAHLKASLLGSSLSIPVAQGRLLTGTWQGIYMGEHREHGGARSVVMTLQGQFD
ncbi:secondary thiamine-phosphate synthase enzyme YjbQ [Ferrimonas pelagia]|uniref:Secondary thiamine-phosphate synthase enzyme YjbQ n=1 Tax=Ferrimonas pelagia TaxID=1177826 RepID=A0ABP9EN59_9GAMM